LGQILLRRRCTLRKGFIEQTLNPCASQLSRLELSG
jgi:hypothetical protein